MKLLYYSVCLCLVWLTYQAYGQVVAPVEWEEQAPRHVNSNYMSRGWCRFKFSNTYQPGEFKINITFDKQLTKFNDFNNWDRIDSNSGYWYYSQSKWHLNNGQEQRIEFNTKWKQWRGIERPNALCIANLGTASVTSAATTQSPPVTSGASTSTTETTTTAAPSTTEPPSECGSSVVYGNTWMQNGQYNSRGECKLSFDEMVLTGDLKVNVTFETAVSSFNDFSTMDRISSDPAGNWYYSKSKWQFSPNQKWGYAFQVSWDSGNPPTAMCYSNIHCNDGSATSEPTTPTEAPTAVPETTKARVSSLAPDTTTAESSSSAPETTTAEATTALPDTTPAEITTAGPETTAAPVTTTSPVQTSTVAPTTPSDNVFSTFNYAHVIDMSMDFFAAQRSGALPDNRIPWRGDSALGDQGDNGEDLTGGYYDAGDHVKFNFPMASSITLLAWGQYVFSDVYDEFGLSSRMRETIKYATDYFLKCWIDSSDNPVYYGQVGDGYVDHSFWGRPEEMNMQRPTFSLNRNKPGSDLAAETAAALAAGSLVFRTTDPTYSATLLGAAKGLYQFAETYRGVYTNSITNAGGFYASSGYNDELMLGAVILYEASGDTAYRTKAENIFPSSNKNAWALSWDDKNVLAQLIVYNMTGNNEYREPVDNFLRRYRGDVASDLSFVDGVLAWRSQWAPLRYSANAALVALLAADAGIDEAVNVNWAQSQIDYMLGDNKDRFSYVIGFGNSFPLKPHHRSSSCPDLPATCNSNQLSSPDPNPHILIGGLVGGPDASGNYQDDRNNFQSNEVACDYNAGFTSALAGLTHFRALLSR